MRNAISTGGCRARAAATPAATPIPSAGLRAAVRPRAIRSRPIPPLRPRPAPKEGQGQTRSRPVTRSRPADRRRGWRLLRLGAEVQQHSHNHAAGDGRPTATPTPSKSVTATASPTVTTPIPGVPSSATDLKAQQDIVGVLVAERQFAAERGIYTDDGQLLLSFNPTINYGHFTAPGEVSLGTNPDSTTVCIGAQGSSGRRFWIGTVGTSAASTVYYSVSDTTVDYGSGCTAAAVASWGTTPMSWV